MHRHPRRLVLPALGLLVATIGWGWPGQASAPSAKISIVPGPASVKVLIDASAPLSGVTAAYGPNLPSTLVVDLGAIAPLAKPAVPAEASGLIRDIRIEPNPAQRMTLILALAEPLPYTLAVDKGQVVVEIIRILREGGDVVPPEVKKELNVPGRGTATVEDVVVSDRGETVNVTARTDRKAVTNVFALGQPLRLVVDLFDTAFARPTLVRSVGKAGVNQVRAGQYKDAPPLAITRIVLELAQAGLFRVNVGERDVTVSYAAQGAKPQTAAASPKPAPAAAADPKPTPAAAAPAGQPAAAPAQKTTPPAETAAKPQDAAAKPKPAPTAAAPAAGQSAAASAQKTTPPVEAAVKPQAEKPAEKQAGSKPQTAKQPPAEEQNQAEKAKTKTIYDTQQKFTGDLLSPKFKDADLRDVILWLGEKYELNVIFDPEVRGSVTGAWVNVPWDQFLDMILKINKMGKSLEGNVLRIMPLNTMAEEERALQAVRDAKEQSGPLITKTYELSYAKASDVLNLMKNRKSSRGDIVIDERTNTIIATDVTEKIDLLDKLISSLDTATPQVQIETRIIEATSTFVRNLGIQWGWKGNADPFYGNQTSLEFPNKISMNGAMIPSGTVTRGIGGPLGGYAVNLPAAAFNTAVGVSFANVLDSFRLDLALSAMETEGTGRIVSSQRATTLNNKEAYINQGRQIPVQTQANFTVTTQFFNAGLELRATPQITAEGTIIMAIDIQNNAADFSNLVNGIPPITTQSAKTTVLVPDGGTTIIGGVYRSEDSITRERVPFLHQIPILGNLFKNLAKTRTNRELLIFITPRIIQ